MSNLILRRMKIVAAITTLTLWLAPALHPSIALAEGEDSVSYHSEQTEYDGKSFTAQWVAVDLLDPFLKITPVVASSGIGHVESFADMMGEHDAIAGINGTFFDAYEADDAKRYPDGLMLKAGSIVRSGENAAFGVLADKSTLVQKTKLGLKVSVDHQGRAYSFAPWGVNAYYGDDQNDQVVWFTPEFGSAVAYSGGTKIVVEDHQVVNMTQEAVDIPEDGQVIFVGNSDNNQTYLLPHIHVGDRITASASAVNMQTQKEIPFSQWEAAIGAGPLLVSAGEVDVDFARDGFTDPKITTTANARSFIGTDSEGRMAMGTMSSATIADMAHVLQQLGFVNAINLDGGASSGLYYDGEMLRTPGRLLSNAFMVQRMDKPQVQVVVNSQLIDEYRGFIQNDTTMVPFRGIFEAIGADFHWDDATRTLTAHKGSANLVLQPDISTALVNGKVQTLQTAPVIVDGHIYIPLRFAGETLGATVGWDQRLYRASLTLPR